MSAKFTGVLDASALLALLYEEGGEEVVRPAVEGAAISAVNWCEVAQQFAAAPEEIEPLRADIEGLGLSVLPFDTEQASAAARLWPQTQHAGLSLADRACLALAQRLSVPALTGDRAWNDLALEIEIRLIR